MMKLSGLALVFLIVLFGVCQVASAQIPTPTPYPYVTPASTFDASKPPGYYENTTSNATPSDSNNVVSSVVSESYTIPLYLPSGITINYYPSQSKLAYTNSSQGGQYYDSSSSSGMYSIQMLNVDTYNIHVEVRYGSWVNQTIYISIVSGNQTDSLNDFQINPEVSGTGFNLDIQVSTKIFPQIPTADENAAAFMTRYNSAEANMTAHNDAVSQKQTDELTTIAVLSIIGTCIAILAVIVGLKNSHKNDRMNAQIALERGNRN
jgi:hypothetical protein